MSIPMSDADKLGAAWHLLRVAKQLIPASGSVSVGPALAHIEDAQEELRVRHEMAKAKEEEP